MTAFSHPDRPGGIPARNEQGERLLLYIGIIDILQSYRFKKKLEHTWKAMLHDGVRDIVGFKIYSLCSFSVFVFINSTAPYHQLLGHYLSAQTRILRSTFSRFYE